MQEKGSSAMVRLFRHEDAKKVWDTPNELRAQLKEMKRISVQRGRNVQRRYPRRSSFKNNTFSCVDLTGKIGLPRVNHKGKAKKRKKRRCFCSNVCCALRVAATSE